jgi:hypothetical protein
VAGWFASLRRRPRRVAAAAVVLAAAAALAIGLTLGGGSTRVSWTPTEGRKPVRTVTLIQSHTYTFAQAVKAGVTPSLKEQEQESGLPLCGTKPPTSGKARAAYERTVKRNDGDTCMADPREATYGTAGKYLSFFALNSVPNGHDTLRYVDSARWAIVYPRAFHAVAFSSSTGTAAGEDGANFANFTPVPAPDAGPPVPPHGVLLAITSSWNHVSGRARLAHDSRFPLHLPASFHAHSTGSVQSADFQFQGDGVAYDASLIAGPRASRADLEALKSMVESISFPPATTHLAALHP